MAYDHNDHDQNGDNNHDHNHDHNHSPAVATLTTTHNRMNPLEQGSDVDNSGHSFGQFESDSLHERDHAFVAVVMTGDDPDHAKGVHHRRESLDDNVEVAAVGDVLPPNAFGEDRGNETGGMRQGE